jgi:peptide deformylase
MTKKQEFDPTLAAYWLTDAALKTVCAPVEIDTDLRNLADCMLRLMFHKRAIGLAANQVGAKIRVIGLATPQFSGIIANPEIMAKHGMKIPSAEGCLSFPGHKAVINRFAGVTLRGYHVHPSTDEWFPMEVRLGGLSAFAAQHEIDHLNGVTIVDHPDRIAGPVKVIRHR